VINSFHFGRLPRIFFGKGKISEIQGIMRGYGREVLLVTGKSSFMNSQYGAMLLSSFEENGIAVNRIIISSEPTPERIDEAVLFCRFRKPDVVIAIGGGSVMDAGKAISAMLTQTGSVFDYLEGVGSKEPVGSKVPFIAIPTTSGTGSEATKNAVISVVGENGFKRSLRHDNFVPDIAIVDPELTLNCPPDITAASGMDCFTQLTEAFLSDKSNQYTDALAIEGLKAVKSSLAGCVNDGTDIEARTGMSFAALTSGICLANAGLGVVHGFASSIGARYIIPHGLICGTLMAVSNELNISMLRKSGKNPEALKKYAELGELFLDVKNKANDYYIDGFIAYLQKITSELHLPGLKEAGVREEDFEEICRSTDCKNNPVMLSKDELREILTKRYI
jgi:alcohol dehydrogenase class IV